MVANIAHTDGRIHQSLVAAEGRVVVFWPTSVVGAICPPVMPYGVVTKMVIFSPRWAAWTISAVPINRVAVALVGEDAGVLRARLTPVATAGARPCAASVHIAVKIPVGEDRAPTGAALPAPAGHLLDPSPPADG